MGEIMLELLRGKDWAITILLAIVVVVVLFLIGLFTVAFFQGRKIRVGPIEIDPKTTKTKDGARDPRVTVFLGERSSLSDDYTRYADAAGRIDIITLTMQVLLDTYGDDRLMTWISEGKEIRILVPSPGSTAVEIRSREEGIDVSSKILTQIKRLKTCVYDRIQKLQLLDIKCTGLLEVRLYNSIPYFAYFCADKKMIIGLYYAHLKGLQSEAISIGAESPVYAKMQRHFEALWEGQKETIRPQDRVVCKIAESNSHFIDSDTLRKLSGTA